MYEKKQEIELINSFHNDLEIIPDFGSKKPQTLTINKFSQIFLMTMLIKKEGVRFSFPESPVSK